MPVTIRAAEEPLAKIFSNDYVFTIPRYQRPYSWTTEEAGELLEDFLPYLEDTTLPIENLDPYFLGSIVLIKGDGPSAEVVDGQQRLTTLTILLATIRASVPDMAQHFTKFLYEEGSPILGTSDRYRLTLRERDAAFFQQYIQKEGGLASLRDLSTPTSDSQSKIQKNAIYYLNRLEKMTKEERVRLAQYVINRCYLVVVRTPDFDSAYRIFSVLNDRGLDLTHSDILKADIIGRLPVSIQDSYTKKWETEEDNLGRDGFKELFAHIRMIYRKRKLEKTVLQEVREHVKPTNNAKAFIDEVLIPFAQAMNDIRTATYENASNADAINELFGWLNRIDNNDWLPPAIWYLAHNRNDSPKLLAYFRDLERLAMGLFILRFNINERIERYARLLTAMQKGEDMYAPSSPLQLTMDECNRIVETLNGPVYNITKIRMPLLLRLDAVLSSGGATYNYPKITIEHVLPQNPDPNGQWCKWFPDQAEREKAVHRLSNLVLLTQKKNSQAQNFEFERKKIEYFARKGVSPFVLTTQVLQEDEWKPQVLENRQEKLLKKLKGLWRL
ncbi:DUF262 domain-containing protein [Heliorestis acidaminivorans]|uniref:DUF262 domain-containing protein n=1 Tax=Heliorestis acidaminivorans TaxID=553427 RepID=A0A6I0EVF1_9FIRM|nr:DUF262 domain-containing protein [Heliorestis acidaminivorans]KAB2953464.1 DUF262 domain-containing protein [Heliorestis acidaminivorans]